MKNLIDSIRSMYQTEAAPGGSNAAIVTDPHQAIKQKAMDDAKDTANRTATGPGERDKIVKLGVTKEDIEIIMTAEEFDQLDELTKKTLVSYSKKARASMGKAENDMSDDNKWDSMDHDEQDKTVRTQFNRSKGLNRADKRLAKEEFDVNETVYHHTPIEIDLELSEADKGYDAYFRAMMKKHGINNVGEFKSDDEKKAFFNKVDAGFKAKNEEVFLESSMMSALHDVKAAHRKAGNRISDEKSATKNGLPHHSFVVTTPEGKRTRHIYHGTKKSLETMSPAAKSKIAKEVGDDDDDK